MATLPNTIQFINDLLSQLQTYSSNSTSPDPATEDTSTRHGHGHEHPHPSTQASANITASAFHLPPSKLTSLKPSMLTLHCLFPNEFLLALDILDRGLVRRVILASPDSRAHAHAHSHAHAQADPMSDDDEQEEKEEEGRENEPETRKKQEPPPERKEDFFFVTSASISSPSHHHAQNNHWYEKGYEVRLQAWNCTCPSFTIAAFRDLGPEVGFSLSSSSSSSSSSSPSLPENRNRPASFNQDDARDHDQDRECATVSPEDNRGDGYEDLLRYSFGGTLPLPSSKSAPPVCKHILACLLAAVCPGLGSGSGPGEGGGCQGVQRFVTLARGEVGGLCAGWGG